LCEKRWESPNTTKTLHIWGKKRRGTLNILVRHTNSRVATNHLQNSCSSSISIPDIRHPRRLCANMDMFRFRNLMTHLNRLNPRMSHHILNRRPICGIGFQHLANEAATSSGIEIIDRRGTWCHSLMWTGTSCNIGRIELVRSRLRWTPWKFLEVQAVVDYPACPDIHQPGVIGYHHRRKLGFKNISNVGDATLKSESVRFLLL
jgi:hypothetical protein